MLNVYFCNKNEQMFQTDLNSDLKEEPDFTRMYCFTLFEQAMSESWIYLDHYVPKQARVLNMPESA